MSYFVDTHCHLNMMAKKEFDVLMTKQQLAQAEKFITEAKQKSVTGIVNVATSFIETQNCIMLARKYTNVFSTIGIHPCDAKDTWRSELNEMEKWTQDPVNKVVGVGECGIDLYHKITPIIRQLDVFRAQIELSLEYNLALVVHSREAYDETLRILEEYKDDLKRVIIHCFSYDTRFAKTVADWGFFLGIGGAITYPKNVVTRQAVIDIPLSAMVLETDAPFLPIQSMRGKENHPCYIPDIASYIAEIKDTTIEEVAEVTTKNAEKLFNINIKI